MRWNGSTRRLLAGIIAGSLLAVGALAPRLAAVSAPRFRTTLDAHLGAIVARDIQALLPTLTTGEALTMIAPNGYKFDTRTQSTFTASGSPPRTRASSSSRSCG